MTATLTRNTASLPAVEYRATGGDDYAAIQGLLDSGTTVYLSDDTYLVSDQLVISVSGTRLYGKMRGLNSSGAPLTGSTSIWRTANPGSGAVLRVRPTTSPPYSTPPLLGVIVQGLNLLGNAKALFALEVNACRESRFSDLTLQGATSSQELIRAGYTAGDATDMPGNLTFERTSVSAGTTTAGLTITKGNSLTFHQQAIGCTDGPGLLMNGPSDDVTFHDPMFGTAGTGYCFDIDQSYSTRFFGGWPMYGLATSPVGGKGILRSASKATQFLGWSTIDRTAKLEVEDGATYSFIDDLGRTVGIRQDSGQGSILEDDFNGTGNIAWLDVSTSGGTTPQGSGFIHHPGIRDLITGITNGAVAALAASTTQDFDPASTWEAVVCGAPTVDANTVTRYGFCGAGTAANNPPATGIWIENVAGEASWFGVCRNAGTQTRSAAIVAASTGAYQRLRMRRTATGIGFHNMNSTAFTNDSDISTVTTNIPTASLVPFAQCVMTAGGVSKTFNLDYFRREIRDMAR